MKEVNVKHSAVGPILFANLVMIFGHGGFLPIKRCSIFQNDKWRPVDDATQNGLNSHYICSESVQLIQADWTAAVWKYWYNRTEGTEHELGGTSDDESNAYRSSPVHDPSLIVVFATWPEDGVAYGLLVRWHNFGLAAAMTNYCRESALVTAVARRFWLRIISSTISPRWKPSARVDSA